jgi:hypothetical protein
MKLPAAKRTVICNLPFVKTVICNLSSVICSSYISALKAVTGSNLAALLAG